MSTFFRHNTQVKAYCQGHRAGWGSGFLRSISHHTSRSQHMPRRTQGEPTVPDSGCGSCSGQGPWTPESRRRAARSRTGPMADGIRNRRLRMWPRISLRIRWPSIPDLSGYRTVNDRDRPCFGAPADFPSSARILPLLEPLDGLELLDQAKPSEDGPVGRVGPVHDLCIDARTNKPAVHIDVV